MLFCGSYIPVHACARVRRGARVCTGRGKCCGRNINPVRGGERSPRRFGVPAPRTRFDPRDFP